MQVAPLSILPSRDGESMYTDFEAQATSQPSEVPASNLVPTHWFTIEFPPNEEREYQQHMARVSYQASFRVLTLLTGLYALFTMHNVFAAFDSDPEVAAANIRYCSAALPPLVPIPFLLILSRRRPNRMQAIFTACVCCLGTSVLVGGVITLLEDWHAHFSHDVDLILDRSCVATDFTESVISRETVSGWDHMRMFGTTREMIHGYAEDVVMPIAAANVNLIRPMVIITLAPLLKLDFVHCVFIVACFSLAWITLVANMWPDTQRRQLVLNEVLVCMAAPALSCVMLVHVRHLERFQRAAYLQSRNAHVLIVGARNEAVQLSKENEGLKAKLQEERRSRPNSEREISARSTDDATDTAGNSARVDLAGLDQALGGLESRNASEPVVGTIVQSLKQIHDETKRGTIGEQSRSQLMRAIVQLKDVGSPASANRETATSSAAGAGDVSGVLGHSEVARLPTVAPLEIDVLLQVQQALRMEGWNLDTLRMDNVAGHRPLYYCSWAIFLQHDLVNALGLSQNRVGNYLHKIDGGYRDCHYHNSAHAADVTSSLHWLLVEMYGGHLHTVLNRLEFFAGIVAAAVHDFNHPGRTNAFLVKTKNDLALTYSDSSVLERMHVAQAFTVATQPDCDIFNGLSNKAYTEVRKVIIDLVLSTDLSNHLTILQKLRATVSSNENNQATATYDPLFMLRIMIKTADLGHAAKPIDLHGRWAARIVEEFFEQGDAEQAWGLPVSPFMDRLNENSPKNQIGFFQFVVIPFFSTVSDYVPGFDSILMQANNNFELWKQAAAQNTTAINDIRTHIFGSDITGERWRSKSQAVPMADPSNSFGAPQSQNYGVDGDAPAAPASGPSFRSYGQGGGPGAAQPLQQAQQGAVGLGVMTGVGPQRLPALHTQ